MRLEVNEKDKLAMLWLTNAEQEDAQMQEQMSQKISEYRQQKYTVAVFRSGKSDLTDVTEGLLLYNQKVAAQRDLEQEQETSESFSPTMNM